MTNSRPDTSVSPSSSTLNPPGHFLAKLEIVSCEIRIHSARDEGLLSAADDHCKEIPTQSNGS